MKDSPDSLTLFQLKEKLYLDAIEFLDKGKVYKMKLFVFCTAKTAIIYPSILHLHVR